MLNGLDYVLIALAAMLAGGANALAGGRQGCDGICAGEQVNTPRKQQSGGVRGGAGERGKLGLESLQGGSDLGVDAAGVGA